MNSEVHNFSENFQKSKKYQRFSCFKRKNLLWHVLLGYRSWEEYMQWNSIKWLFFIVDWDHAFHNVAKIPGSDNTFSHVLLTPWAQMFIGSCASVRFPCYEVLFFFFFFPCLLKGSLEKRMATHSSILAWRIPWTEEPGKLQSLRLQRIGHDWVTNTFLAFSIM